MTDPAPVLRREVDALIRTRITTVNSAKPQTLRREPFHKLKVTYFLPLGLSLARKTHFRHPHQAR
jgi:hypothetical protein